MYQGAGETLRGTFNIAMESKLGHNPNAVAEQQRVIDAGRQEIDTGKLNKRNLLRKAVPQRGHVLNAVNE